MRSRLDSSELLLASRWVLDARLPKGYHTVTLTVDDGSGNADSTSIVVRVEESAPILVLDSPIPDAEVYSNGPVLFDFRRSFDPDGDDFTVTVTSNLLLEPILEDKTTEYSKSGDWSIGALQLLELQRGQRGSCRMNERIAGGMNESGAPT